MTPVPVMVLGGSDFTDSDVSVISISLLVKLERFLNELRDKKVVGMGFFNRSKKVLIKYSLKSLCQSMVIGHSPQLLLERF